MQLRPASPDDRDDVYAICRLTGAGGADATPLLAPEAADLVGDVWAGRYLALAAGWGIVAVSGRRVVGYVLGADDTRAFESAGDSEWWPALRTRHPAPRHGVPLPGWSLEDRLRWLVHSPPRSPAEVVAEFPAHLHLDVLPAAQGQGVGPRLLGSALQRLAAAGVTGVHVGVGRDNARAGRFWRRGGFREVSSDAGTDWLGRPL